MFSLGTQYIPTKAPVRLATQEWARLDRPYCSSDLFRQLILDNVTATEADCRTDIRERISKCNNEVCPQCVSPCNFPVARTVAQVLRCMDSTRHFGFLWFYQVSDAGQLARSMHGARRKDNYKAVSLKHTNTSTPPTSVSIALAKRAAAAPSCI